MTSAMRALVLAWAVWVAGCATSVREIYVTAESCEKLEVRYETDRNTVQGVSLGY